MKSVWSVCVLAAWSAVAAPKPEAVAKQEAAKAQAKKGDVARGQALYDAVCASCHLPSGAGQPDGSFPQLAGQHPVVLIKQLADIRAGVRSVEVMQPAAAQLKDPQELADVAAYLKSLPIPRDNGRGDGAALDEGQELYQRDCLSCHGRSGEGNAKKLYPVLAGQHFKYLLRQGTAIRDGGRKNADPKMVKVMKSYTDAQVTAVVDFMSRLVMPEAPAPKAPPAKK